MARPLAVTIGLRRSLLLAASALACGPALAPSRAERATSAQPVAASPREDTSTPPSSEQADLRQRFDSVKALSRQRGEASYYSDSLAGRSTASGQAYDPERYTAAHRDLPFGTMLRVRRADDGRSVYVRVNDRGPFGSRKRIVDLSGAAAEELGMLRQGVVPVTIEVVERADAPAVR
jgi:rare lipoprotein A